MNQIEQWHNEALGRAACSALQKNGFKSCYFATRNDVTSFLNEQFSQGLRVGLGGSVTLRELEIVSLAQKAGVIMLDHSTPGLSPEEKMAVMRAQLTCDLFVSSANAITLDGEIFNVDGNGNRVAALSFGPAKVIVVVGINKIVRSLDKALARLETRASPMNNKRLGIPNPCTVAGLCSNCTSETRICRIYTTLKRRPRHSDFTVAVVGEKLGF